MYIYSSDCPISMQCMLTYILKGVSLVTQRVKPAMWETWVRSLGEKDPLEKEMANLTF